MKTYKFTIVIEKDEDSRYVAVCPALQGCYAEGTTEKEAVNNLEDAVKLHIKARRSKGEAIHEEVGTSKITVTV
jgi:predicted RNase H-like HicB family nuclease